VRTALFTLLVAFSLGATAAALPYDESANAKQDVRRALADAASRGVPMLIVFGANWCEDCRALDLALHRGKSAALVGKSFSMVKVDVGELANARRMSETGIHDFFERVRQAASPARNK
jgi:thioredoxin